MEPMQVRVELSVAPPVSGGHNREELVAFALYCAARITRDLPGPELCRINRWDLFVASGLDGQADAVVRAHVGRDYIEARGSGCDPAQAIWAAMCQVEQPLREAAVLLAS
jgi:hypothetical protein